MRRALAAPALIAATLGVAACATLGGLFGVQEPRFTPADGRASSLRILGPSLEHPRGAATVRVWAQVVNPNAFGFTLSTLDGRLALEGDELVDVSLPLGLPLLARADTVVPLELTFGFESLSSLRGVATSLFARGSLDYELEGTLGVNAGALGTPTFGPRTWLAGTLTVQNPLGLGR